MPLSLTLTILAGGAGARMGGRIKPLLAGADGRSLLERIEGELGQLAEATLVVAPSELHARLAPKTRGTLIADRGHGPRAALIESAGRTDAEWILLVGGDHPSPSRALAERLLALAGGHDGATVRREGRLEPLFAVYKRTAIAALVPRGSLMKLLEGLDVAVVDAGALSPAERAALLDVDTPEEAREAGLG